MKLLHTLAVVSYRTPPRARGDETWPVRCPTKSWPWGHPAGAGVNALRRAGETGRVRLVKSKGLQAERALRGMPRADAARRLGPSAGSKRLAALSRIPDFRTQPNQRRRG